VSRHDHAAGLSQPCPQCATGEHRQCEDALCGCIVVHQGDSPAVRGFKLVKQRAHPERAAWTKGGFTPGSRALDIHATPNIRTKGTKMTDQAQSPHDDAESHPVSCAPGDLALHLASEHADPMAMDRARILNEGQHHHEHTGPGTIRHHAEDDFSYDLAKVRAVLMEAEGDDWQQQETPPDYTPDEPVRIEIEEDREPAYPEGDARMRAVYRQPDDNDMLGDPPFDLEEAKRRLDETLLMFSQPHGLYIFDPSTPRGNLSLSAVTGEAAIEMIEETPSIFGRPAFGKSIVHDPAILAAGQSYADDASLPQGYHLALHLSAAHGKKESFVRTPEQNEAEHRAIPPHRHTEVQHRYERAVAEKIEADLGDGTLTGWRPVPHPPHEVADLARMIGDVHRCAPAIPADLIAVDLAWIKMATWPWHRRLRAALLLAFSRDTAPSWSFGARFEKRAGE
jgi:hypothetical protein